MEMVAVVHQQVKDQLEEHPQVEIMVETLLVVTAIKRAVLHKHLHLLIHTMNGQQLLMHQKFQNQL